MTVKDFIKEVTSLCEGKLDREIKFFIYDNSTEERFETDLPEIQSEPISLADTSNNWGIEVWLDIS